MSETILQSKTIVKNASAFSDFYSAVWRWHFYAGLLILPFMITLAITGALYLFHGEIDAIMHSNLKRVEVIENIKKIAPSSIVAAALSAYPGTAVKYTGPATPDSSAEITVNTFNNSRLAVYINPYTGQALGSLPDRGTVMWTVRHLHSLKYFGSFARAFIEIAGGWSIVLVGTGLYLWWPRKRKGGVITVRGTPKKRVFWRDIHAVTGLFVSFFIVFLAVTGMPWSGVWGAKVNQWANGNNFGYPAGVRVAVPMSNEHLDHIARTTWSLEQAKIPLSSEHSSSQRSIGLDAAVTIFNRLGLRHGYAVNIPAKPGGVFTGSVYPDDLSQQRVIHLDQYTGEPLIDMSYRDYGLLARGFEWGINVHMGQEFGLANKIVLLIACMGIVLLAVSAAVMWWKRRPAGSLGIPAMPEDKYVMRGLLAILIINGVIFPLVGLSLVVMLLFDWVFVHMKASSEELQPVKNT